METMDPSITDSCLHTALCNNRGVLFCNLISQAGDAFYIIDPETATILMANEAAWSNLGYSEDEFHALKISDIEPTIPDDAAWKLHVKWLSKLGRVVRQGVHICKNGEVIHVEISSSLVEKDGRKFVIWIIRDNTERKHTEEELRRAYAQNEQILSSLPIVLIGVDSDEKISHWDAAAEKAFGRTGNEMIRVKFIGCGIGWNWACISEAVRRCIEDIKPVSISEMRYSRPEGGDGFLKIIISPFAGLDPTKSGYLVSAVDITERKIMEDQINREATLKSIGQLAAGIAHEINTPIQYVGDNTRFI